MTRAVAASSASTRSSAAASVAAGIAHASAAPESLVGTAVELVGPRTGKARSSLAALKRQIHGAALALLPDAG